MNSATRTEILFFAFLLYPFYSTSQCSEMGTRSGSIFSNNNSIGSFAFSSPENILSSDNNRASATALLTLLNGNTNYLKASGFGFTIPPGAVICGVKVELEKSATGINILAWVRDNSVRLVKAGNIVGSNNALPGNWTSTETYSTYGAITDDWGTSWTPDEINDPDFGIVFSARITGLITLLPSARVDHVSITVYYNLVLPLEILSFTAKPHQDHSAVLQWSFGDKNAIERFSIERKTVGDNWATIHSQAVGEDVFAQTTSSFTDKNRPEREAQYRLKMEAASGKIEYSKIVTVRWETRPLHVYPNPATDHFYIRGKLNSYIMTGVNVSGVQYNLPLQKAGTDHFNVNIQQLPSGYWWFRVDDKWFMIQKL
jgi:hypothetical protein